jgi:hypothetical protein
MSALLNVEHGLPFKQVLEGVRDVTLIHYPSRTDSIKPSLQFLCNFAVNNAEGSLCFQIYFFANICERYFYDSFVIY